MLFDNLGVVLVARDHRHIEMMLKQSPDRLQNADNSNFRCIHGATQQKHFRLFVTLV